MKAVVAAFNQEKALVGAFSVIANLRMDLFEALVRAVNFNCRRRAAACAARCWGTDFRKKVQNPSKLNNIRGTLIASFDRGISQVSGISQGGPVSVWIHTLK